MHRATTESVVQLPLFSSEIPAPVQTPESIPWAVDLDERDTALIAIVQSFGADNQARGFQAQTSPQPRADIVERYGNATKAHEIACGMQEKSKQRRNERTMHMAVLIGASALKARGRSSEEIDIIQSIEYRDLERAYGPRTPLSKRRAFIEAAQNRLAARHARSEG